MDNLIYDRTQSDVTNRTDKGYYNASDLNRVEEWCRYLANELNRVGYSINITTKTNWTTLDLRSSSDMQRIKNNILAIMRGFHWITPIYNSVDNWDYIKANRWEQILNEIYNLVWGMEDWYVYSGVANAGQNRLWQHRFRDFYVSPIAPPYEAILTENGDELTTENGEALELTIGVYVDESDNQIITEDGNEWEVE